MDLKFAGLRSAGLVSVVIPVHNCQDYIAEAIRSVLAQTYSHSEILIVDDGSTDRSAEIIKSFASDVQYIYQEQSGAATARNHGVDSAKGEWIAFLDADDMWESNKLESQLIAFSERRSLDIVFGHVQQFYSPELPEAIRRTISIPAHPTPGYHVGTLLMKTSAYRRVGPFLPHLKMGEFAEWYSRATAAGLSSEMLPGILMKRRIHANNMGRREQHNRIDYVRALRAGLDEKRRRARCETQIT